MDREPQSPFARYPLIRKRFITGPSLLLETEWLELETCCPGDHPGLDTVLECPRNSSASGPPTGRPGRVIFDVRTLQYPYFNGSKQHAAALLRILCPWLAEEGIPFSLLTSAEKPPFSLTDIETLASPWDPSAEVPAAAYMNLDPLHDSGSSVEIPFLEDPGIWKCAVWLDAIIGAHPHSFLPTEERFWAYQAGLEKLASYHDLFCISPTALEEARRIFHASVHLHHTPCIVPEPRRSESLKRGENTDAPYFISMGNFHPHKNLVAAVAGAAAARSVIHPAPRLVLVGNLEDVHVNALRQIALKLDVPEEDLQVHSRVEPDWLDELLHGASLMIAPSLHEGFSLPVVEALHAGIPVCLSSISAHRDLLEGAPGFFQPEDPWSLRNALLDIMVDPDTCYRAQQKVLQQRYQPDITARVLLSVFKQRLGC